MKVDFRRLTWENYPSEETPINADNLNRLEEGVAGLYSDMAGIEEGIDSFKDETSAQVGAMQTRLTTMEGDIDSFQEITLGQVGSMQTRVTSMENGLPTMVSEQIDNKFGDDIGDNVTSWLTEHVTPSGSAVVVDDTLTIAGAAADAKKTGDEISFVKEALNAVSNGNIYILDNLNLNKFINASTGKLAPYTGWNATDFVSCDGFSNLYIYSTELSRGYNAFYTSNDENSFVSNFSVAVGDNAIAVPSNAKYFRLSNSSSAISSTRVYGVVKTEVANLNAQMYKLFPGIRQTDSVTWESGYYSATGKPAGSGSTTNIRSITTDFIQCGKGSTFQLLSVANGERARLGTYSAPNDDTFIERITDTNTSVHTIQYDCFVRLNLFYTDGSEISDQSEMINNFILRAIQLGYVTGSMLETTNENVYALKKLVPTLQADWASKVQDIQQAQGTKFTFAIQTDTHYYDGYGDAAANNLKLLSNYVGFDFIANLGDVIRGYADETIDSDTNMRLAMTEIMHRYVTGISCPLLIAMGNHDMNPMWADAFSGQKFTNAEIWGRMFRPSFNTAPKAVTATGKMYYYIDYDDIRVIVLNTQDGNDQGFGISAEQLSWFTDIALNTTKWVLVLSHVPLVNGWSVGSNYVSDYANIVTALQDFKANSGKVIGCMSGHTHTQEDKTVDGMLYVTFRNGGNYSEVVQVDLVNKAINTITCGFNGNRSFTFA